MQINQVGVTGVNGRVASRLVDAGARPLSFDITKPAEIVIPDDVQLVINCAAITTVDGCEEFPEIASRVNIVGVHNLINACYPNRVKLVHISSDHVFNGNRWFGSYKETDTVSPINVYGMSKAVGELFVGSYEQGKIVRTSYLAILGMFGGGQCEFSTKIKRTFMTIDNFIECLVYYVENYERMPRILHISGTKKYNWYDAMKHYLTHMDYDASRLVKKTRWDTKGFAPRPKNGGLDVSLAKKLGVPVKSLEEGIKSWKF